MKRLEALADAFAKLNGALDPLSEAYKLRNPGMLRAFNPKHERDVKGNRRFRHFIAGYENLLLDLRIKCSGNSRARLVPDSPLVDLVHTYGQPTAALKPLVRFLRHALNDDNIPEAVQLKFFMEDTDGRSNTVAPVA